MLLVAGATALLAVACGDVGPTTVNSGAMQGGDLATSSTTMPAEELAAKEAEMRSEEAGEPQGVLDNEGNLRGYYSPDDIIDRDRRAVQVLQGAGLLTGDVIDIDQVTQEQIEAALVVSAVPLHDAAGDHTGYLGLTFIELDAYPQRVQAAESVLSIGDR